MVSNLKKKNQNVVVHGTSHDEPQWWRLVEGLYALGRLIPCHDRWTCVCLPRLRVPKSLKIYERSPPDYALLDPYLMGMVVPLTRDHPLETVLKKELSTDQRSLPGVTTCLVRHGLWEVLPLTQTNQQLEELVRCGVNHTHTAWRSM